MVLSLPLPGAARNPQLDQIPPFEEAVSRFSDFLASKDLPNEIVWVFREDFYSPSLKRHFVRYPLPPENTGLADSYFESGRTRGLGVQLRGLFEIEGATGATVWLPNDALDLKEKISGLNLSVATPLLRSTPVWSALAWRIHRLRSAYRLNQTHGFDIPCRADIGHT